MSSSTSARVFPAIEHFRADHQPAFEHLNRTWIEHYFHMEAIDEQVLGNPQQYILDKGGAILMATVDNKVVGTVALKYYAPGAFEFTKMAVDESYRGMGIGRVLADAAVTEAVSRGAEKLIIYSNTRLTPAITLYKTLGFVEIPVDAIYERCDIKLEMPLTTSSGVFITKANTLHADLIRKKGMEAFISAFARFNTEANMKSYLDQAFSPAQIEQQLTSPDTCFLLAWSNAEVCGYAKLNLHGPVYGITHNSLEVERIYAFNGTRKGVGSELMRYAFTYAADLGFETIWLGVWEHNPDAVRFYERLGFEKFGDHPFMLGDDHQTDWLMKKSIPTNQ